MHDYPKDIMIFIIIGKSLLWVAILLLVILYCYAVISFAFLREELDDEENNRYCTRLDECFISVLRFGLIDSFLVSILHILPYISLLFGGSLVWRLLSYIQLADIIIDGP